MRITRDQSEIKDGLGRNDHTEDITRTLVSLKDEELCGRGRQLQRKLPGKHMALNT